MEAEDALFGFFLALQELPEGEPSTGVVGAQGNGFAKVRFSFVGCFVEVEECEVVVGFDVLGVTADGFAILV